MEKGRHPVGPKRMEGIMNAQSTEQQTEAPEQTAPATEAPKPKKAKAKAKKVAPAKKASKGKSKDATGRTGLVSKVQRPGYVKKYHKDSKNRTSGGHISVDNGDKLASALRGLELKEVYERAAKLLGESVQSLKSKYGKLNPGMQRMNLGNRMRAA